MFQGEDRQALQLLIDNNTITPEEQKTPKHALKAIQSCIKEEEHFWHFRDEVMSDFRQQPEEQIHALNTRITTLVNNCDFQDQQTKDTIKLMLLQHAVKYHEACDWIRLQDQTQLTYTSLLQHCKLLEQCCKQFQKAQSRGRAELTTLSAATATTSSIHQDVISINHQSGKCGHKHPRGNCPAAGKECYNCHGKATIQPCASDPGRIKPIISGPLEDPGTEAHKEASIGVLVVKDILPAEEDNTNRVPTAQEGTEEALHPNLIKAATLQLIDPLTLKINYPQMLHQIAKRHSILPCR